MMEEYINKLLNSLRIEETDSYKCPKCKDVGYIVVNSVAQKCSCNKGKSQLPSKFSKVLLKDFNLNYYPDIIIDPENSSDTYLSIAKKLVKAAKKLVRDIIEDKEDIKGLLIEGPVGSGKTHLASGIYNELSSHDIEAVFYVVPEFLDQSKEDLFAVGEGKGVFNKAKRAKVLILDDLGAHNYTQWSINQLYALINYRLNNELTTIITTNLTLEEIDSLLDQRIASRITDMCLIHSLAIDRDIRSKKRKNTRNS
ncbi:MAG: ATP-binding protein [Fusobacteria bacterium]|nr:ATP-binding protein [Fusobacteriota bacterium]